MSAPRSPRHAPQRLLLGLLLAAVLWLLAPGVASAHAHLVQADPAPDSVIAHAPAVATFLFDEPLNPALTRVRITTASGRQVTPDVGHSGAGHNGELWELALPSLPSGTYSVFWTSESSTDGHVISSFYTFRVSPSGGADSSGAVTGAAAGSYGGGGSGSTGLLSIGGGAAVIAFFSWLGLMAQALWLGALVVELAVLAPVRGGATARARLAWAAAPRLWWLVRGALAVTLAALVLEIVSLAVQGTGGDWGRALAPATLGGIFSSQNGHFMLARFAVLIVALPLAWWAGVPAAQSLPEIARPARRSPQALGITAPGLAAPRWRTVRAPLAVLAAGYMLLVAFSGHAADVTPGWFSYPIDWLHLVFTAAWAGGIAALAFGVLPARHTLPLHEDAPEQRTLAVLFLLDRFSPVAFLAVGVLALTGLYNAVNHLDSPSQLSGTAYGQLLVVKLCLVALLILLSASHVWALRPRLTRLARAMTSDGAPHRARTMKRTAHDAGALAAIHEGVGALAARLRLESGVGAAILLATALMGQTLPSNGAVTPAAPVAPAAITGSATRADLRATLTVAPPAVGTTTFSLNLWEQGAPLNGDNAAALIHLYPAGQHPAGQPSLRANLTTQAQGTRFTARGSLPSTATWRADVLVRTAALNEYRTLPFTFTVGPGASFLAPGTNPNGVTLAVAPALITAPNTFTITGLQAQAVRLLSQSLDMNMGILPYSAQALGGGRWRVSGLYAPMNGRWGLTVQVRQNGIWSSVRQFAYYVPLSGKMRSLTPQTGTPAAASQCRLVPGLCRNGGGTAATPGRHNAALNTSLARTLPYTALVTEMGSNGIRLMKTGALLRTGVQAHGVDVLDGTPYAYVTNFGAEPGTVSQIDMRTMRVVRTFTVGLGPAHVIFTPDHRYAFVTDFNSSDLYAIDLKSGATKRIAFPNDNCFKPHGGDISEDGRTLYVACAGGAWIYTVNTVTMQPQKAVITGPGAFGVAVNAARHEVWVTNQTVNTVTVLDEKTLKTLATIPVGKGPALLVATPDGRKVYVADQFGNAISVIDAARRTVIATIPVAAQPHGPDVTADGKYVYVASIGGNAVTIIRTSDDKVVAVVPSAVGSNEVAIAH